MTRRWHVVATDPMHPDPAERVERIAQLSVLSGADRPRGEVLGDADALIVRTPISEEDVRVGKNLKVIVRHGAGLDFIPVDLARSLGIAVASVPDANLISVAEHVIGVMLGMARQFARLDSELRSGNWQVRSQVRAHQLAGRTLGIVGVGRIGRLVAIRAAKGLGMRTIGYDPAGSDLPDYVERVASLDALLEAADIVTVHVPFTKETSNLIDGERLRRMKRGSWLINAARGGVVDEAELANCLTDGHLAGAALDVFSRQPIDPSSPLLKAPNTLLTPHSASLTVESYRAMGMGAVEEVERAFRGEPLANPVP
jgi:D-3-phosphoglycerate dehydrogenase